MLAICVQYACLLRCCWPPGDANERMLLQPAAVPVDVEDDVHVLAVRVVDHLFDARHPARIDGRARRMVWQSHAAGMRMALKPAAFTALMNAWLAAGLPQAVSPHWASSVLPRFQPTRDLAGNLRRGRKVCE